MWSCGGPHIEPQDCYSTFIESVTSKWTFRNFTKLNAAAACKKNVEHGNGGEAGKAQEFSKAPAPTSEVKASGAMVWCSSSQTTPLCHGRKILLIAVSCCKTLADLLLLLRGVQYKPVEMQVAEGTAEPALPHEHLLDLGSSRMVLDARNLAEMPWTG